jgi:CheY-like chemotaxis protein
MTKVLLVEDDNNLREIFEMRLQADGFQTLTASDGEEALVVAMREKPDLIVADVMMPKLSGFEMLETLRTAPEMKNIKVVMMTALGQAEDQARGEKLGVLKYLVKSQVTLEDFAKVINEILKPGPQTSENSSDETSGSDKSNTDSTINNNQESEKSMPEDTTPTNPGAPAPTPPAGDNPISTPAAPADGAAGQATTAQAQDGVQNQINDFAASPAPAADASAPAADPAATDTGATPDVPVSTPPAEGGDAAPSEPTPPPAV